jgi:MFS family permease
MEEQRYVGKPETSSYQPATPAESYFVDSDIERPPEQVQTGAPSILPDDEEFVTGIPLACLIIGLMFAVFLISIDRTIISTAIPYITGEFNSTPDIGWYGSAYLLTACAFQPVCGRVFMLFSVKKSYLLAMFFFEFGSLLCGVAPSSMTLIIGRAIAGFGSAGILTGSFVVVATAVPLQLRPVFMAVVGLM